MNKKIAFTVFMSLLIYMATMTGIVLAEETRIITWGNYCFPTGCSQFNATIISDQNYFRPESYEYCKYLWS